MSNEFSYPEVDEVLKREVLKEVADEIGESNVDTLCRLEERLKSVFIGLNALGGIVTYTQFVNKVKVLTVESIDYETMSQCDDVESMLKESILILERVLAKLESRGILEFL